MTIKKCYNRTIMDYKEKIEMYLNGELQGEALKSFLDRLDTDTFYMQEFTIRKEIEDALSETDVVDLKNNLDQIHISFEDQSNSKARKFDFNRGNFRWLMVAASLTLVLLTSGVLFFLNAKSYSSNELYSMYYKPYDSYVNIRSGNINPDDVFINAMIKYENHEFETATELFNQVISVDKTNISSHFYTGVCYIEMENYEKASEAFQFIINHNDNFFIDQANWYLAICYLKSNQEETARMQFESIANSQSYYNNKAVEVLEHL